MKSQLLSAAIALLFCFGTFCQAQEGDPKSPSDTPVDQIQKAVDDAKAQDKKESNDEIKPVPSGTSVAEGDCGCNSGCQKTRPCGCNRCHTGCRVSLRARLRSLFNRGCCR